MDRFETVFGAVYLLWFTWLPVSFFGDESVGQNDQFAHDCGQSYFRWLASLNEAPVAVSM